MRDRPISKYGWAAHERFSSSESDLVIFCSSSHHHFVRCDTSMLGREYPQGPYCKISLSTMARIFRSQRSPDLRPHIFSDPQDSSVPIRHKLPKVLDSLDL